MTTWLIVLMLVITLGILGAIGWACLIVGSDADEAMEKAIRRRAQ